MKISKLIITKLIIVFFIILSIGLYFHTNNPRGNTLRINEVSYSNDLGYDWVEIYNPSLQTKSLKGLLLTDDKKELEKYEIDKDIIIEPNGFVVIYGENYDGNSDNIIQLNFNIKNGETVYLIEKQSLTIIDSLTVLNDEDASPTESIGRFPNGSENTFVFTVSSMGASNIKDHIPGLRGEEL